MTTKPAAPSFTAPPLSNADLLVVAKRIARNPRVRRPDGVDYEDSVQDAVVAILRVQSDWPKKAPPGLDFDKWLFRRVIGILQDQYGTQHARAARPVPAGALRRGQLESGPLDAPTPTAPASTVDMDARMDIESAIAKLPARQRRIVECILLEGRTQTETAEELGIGQSAVSQQFSMARAALRTLLGPDYA